MQNGERNKKKVVDSHVNSVFKVLRGDAEQFLSTFVGYKQRKWFQQGGAVSHTSDMSLPANFPPNIHFQKM